MAGKKSLRSFRKPYLNKNKVRWMQSGSGFFRELAHLISLSSQEIHLQTYIFSSDSTGTMIAESLIAAALRGVQVFLLIDDFGSKDLNADLEKKMVDAGIHLHRYGRLYSKGRFHIGRRLHRKVLVIDGRTALVGGMNISDHYSDTEQSKAWLDFGIIAEGEIAGRLRYVCKARWKGHHFGKLIDGLDLHQPGFHTPLRIRRNDFVRNQNEIAVSYRQAIRQAKDSLIFVGAYFLPGGITRRLFKAAVRQGVEIKILFSERSDVGVMENARKYLYAWLLRNGIHIYEYKHSNVHGKVLIADHQWTTIGSFDLNNLSTFSNIELNLDIKDEAFSKNLAGHILHIMENDSVQITPQILEKKSGILNKLNYWFSYQIVKTLFGLSFYLTGKGRDS